MPNQDVELFQSFCRRYINRDVNEHYRDVDGTDEASLNLDVGRQTIKRICLHKDEDPMTLTLGRLLIWYIEARGLFDDIIYGIPSTDFDIKYTYYPQVKLHFRENRLDAARNNRRPARAEVSFRWRSEEFSTSAINPLINEIASRFATPPFTFRKGRSVFTYHDDRLGYRFQINANDENQARRIIEQTIRLQDNIEPDWENNLRESVDNKNFTTQQTVRVLGDNIQSPKRRPIADVNFAYAELFIPGTTRPLTLVDVTGRRPRALRVI